MNQDTTKLEISEIYNLLSGGVLPRPIAWLSTVNEDGVQNIAPYSFFNVASVNPPILSISHIAPQPGIEKDSLANLRVIPECVINIVDQSLCKKMNASAKAYEKHISEFIEHNIEPVKSRAVKPKGVKAAKIRYECRLKEIINLSNQVAGGQLILLDVVNIYCNDEIIKNGKLNAEKLNAIGKLGGDDYCLTQQTFSLERP